MENKIPHGIHAEKVYQSIRIENISLGFTHLAVTLKQPRMAKYLLGKRQIKGH